MALAREYCTEHFGVAPAGLWPSEGSVSDEVFAIASELGFQWAATDSGVLDRTLGRTVGVDGLYRPYRWRQGGRQLGVIFRDHFLSDLIGFVYSKMDAAAAAGDFLHRIRDNCAGILAGGRDALVPIILDGENAWEYYDRNGRPFLRELYRRISEDERMSAVTVSEALHLAEPEPLDTDLPGIVDQRQLRCLDRRRGRQPGLDATAARAPDVRFQPPASPRTGGGWPSRNC